MFLISFRVNSPWLATNRKIKIALIPRPLAAGWFITIDEFKRTREESAYEID